MSLLFGLLAFVPLVSASIAGYGIYLKHRDEPIQGWHFNTSRSRIVTNGRTDAEVTIRVIGGATLYEAKARVWGPAKVTFNTEHELPKMNCESTPIEVAVDYAPGPDGAPWVGLTWSEPRKGRTLEQAARVNVGSTDYQRWKWNTFRNFFRWTKAPTGKWETIADMKPRKHFEVEPWTGGGIAVSRESIAPLRVWDGQDERA